MKKNQLWIAFVFCTTFSFGQNFDLLSRDIYCSQVANYSSFFFMKYLDEGNIDSARAILKYWETECGESEPLFRARILLALKTGCFHDTLLGIMPMYMLTNYQDRMQLLESYGNQGFFHTYDDFLHLAQLLSAQKKHIDFDDFRYFGYILPGHDFDYFTQEMASELKSYFPENSIEYILAEFYSDNYDTIFVKIQLLDFKESALVKDYHAVVKMLRKTPMLHLSVVAGAWIPRGNLEVIGVRPDLGIQVGAKIGKMNYDGRLMFRFSNPSHRYTFSDPRPQNLQFDFGMYLGFDISRDLYIKNNHELQLAAGAAADFIDFFPGNRLSKISVFTPNFNFGLAYRCYIFKGFYIGMRAKYNVVDYTLITANANVAGFTGNTITFHLSIGGVFMSEKRKALTELGQKSR